MVLSKDLKIAICFGLIIGALVSICNMCFAADAEIVNLSTSAGVNFAGTSQPNFFVSSTSSLFYFEIEPGYHYVVNNSNLNRSFGFSNELPAVDVEYFDRGSLAPNQSFEFNSSEYGYMFFNITKQTDIIVTREKLEGMTGFVDNLAYDLSYANLSGVLFFVVPIMAIGILVALGFYLLKRLLNRIKRAKGGV